jgi:hypothetical protein
MKILFAAHLKQSQFCPLAVLKLFLNDLVHAML